MLTDVGEEGEVHVAVCGNYMAAKPKQPPAPKKHQIAHKCQNNLIPLLCMCLFL